jgi:hypothetical protein
MAERNRIALIQEVRVVHVWKARLSLCPVCALLSIACSRTLVISLFCLAWKAHARARARAHMIHRLHPLRFGCPPSTLDPEPNNPKYSKP